MKKTRAEAENNDINRHTHKKKHHSARFTHEQSMKAATDLTEGRGREKGQHLTPRRTAGVQGRQRP